MTLERIVLSSGIKEQVTELSNRPNELLGYFLARSAPNGIRLMNYVFADASQDCTGRMSGQDREVFKNEVSKLFALASLDDTLLVVSSHIHAVPFGRLVQSYDPYWTVNRNNLPRWPAPPAEGNYKVINFAGDDDAFAFDAERYGVNFHLFVHPAYGSEGMMMKPTTVAFTGFSYEPRAFGNIRPIPVIDN